MDKPLYCIYVSSGGCPKKCVPLPNLSIIIVTKTKITIWAESICGISPFFFFQKFYRTVIFLFLQDSNRGNCWVPCPIDPWWKPWPCSLSLEFFISLSLKPFGPWSGKIFSAPKVRERQWGKSAVKKSASKWVPTKLDWNWPNVSGLCNTLFNEKEDCPRSTTCYLTRTW